MFFNLSVSVDRLAISLTEGIFKGTFPYVAEFRPVKLMSRLSLFMTCCKRVATKKATVYLT